MKVAKANFTRVAVARTNDTAGTLWNITNGEKGGKSANNIPLLYTNQNSCVHKESAIFSIQPPWTM
jgi:hypothetical protein